MSAPSSHSKIKLHRHLVEEIIGSFSQESAENIWNAVLKYAAMRDEKLRGKGREDEIDDKTAFIIKFS